MFAKEDPDVTITQTYTDSLEPPKVGEGKDFNFAVGILNEDTLEDMYDPEIFTFYAE